MGDAGVPASPLQQFLVVMPEVLGELRRVDVLRRAPDDLVALEARRLGERLVDGHVPALGVLVVDGRRHGVQHLLEVVGGLLRLHLHVHPARDVVHHVHRADERAAGIVKRRTGDFEEPEARQFDDVVRRFSGVAQKTHVRAAKDGFVRPVQQLVAVAADHVGLVHAEPLGHRPVHAPQRRSRRR